MPAVRERFVEVNGLRHHVVTWRPDNETGNDAGDDTGDDVRGEPARPQVLLCHGFLDLAWGWRRVAERLVAEGFTVTAFDWRGHGESEWIGRGGYYHFPDYVLDLRDLMGVLGGAPPHLVGHSMGGTACSLFAGTVPNAIRSLTIIEGLGPPALPPALTPDRYGAWLRGVDKARQRTVNPFPNLDAVIKRMRVQNPELEGEWASFLAEKGTKPGPDGEGRVFRFDPLHRSTSPIPFQLDAFRAFLQRITVPTLYVAGSRGFRVDGEAERLACIRDQRMVELDDVGHMLHWFAADRLCAALAKFFHDAEAGPPSEAARSHP